jgi:hypothetical protein
MYLEQSDEENKNAYNKKRKKENPPHVQAHFILFVPHKIKRAFSSPPTYLIISNPKQIIVPNIY